MILEGIIQKDGSVLTEKNGEFYLPFRGTDDDGYPEVIMDAKAVGGYGWMSRQSIKPYIGMTVQFYCKEEKLGGSNYTILPNKEE